MVASTEIFEGGQERKTSKVDSGTPQGQRVQLVNRGSSAGYETISEDHGAAIHSGNELSVHIDVIDRFGILNLFQIFESCFINPFGI